MLIKRLIILLVIPLIFSACTSDKREEITFSSWGSITEVSILEKIIKDFELENPDIKLNFEHIPQNYFQKLHLLFASNTPPDVVFINNLYLPLYADRLEDLSDLIDKNDYYPQSLKSMTYDGKLLAIPRDVSMLVFYRNLNLVDKTPQNLEEFKQILSEVKPFATSYERDVYFMLPYIISFNENIYNAPQAIEFYTHMEGAPSPAQVGSSTQAQMFLDGKIGLYLSGRWMYPKIKEKAKFSWDVITFPGTTPLDSSGWAISKNSKHKNAAKKFVQYMASKENIEYFNSTGLIVPARIDVANKIDDKTFLKAIEKSKAIEIDKNYKKRVDKLNRELFN